ncbi:MAG: Concanavalin A-like lectin/glucanase superfamily [Verrucomicrobiales bacterium]|nr:Concanavalin A-like lectin/glucanase superfamily [Verrucomicrobiales bacterium]
MAIWVNGKKVKEGPFTQGANVGFHAPFNLGRRPGVFNDWFIAGGIDEVRVYNRALDPAEITTVYALEAGKNQAVEIAVETVRLTMHLIPGNSYILQSSSDLLRWVDFGVAFVPDVAAHEVSVTVGENAKFWRVVESP